MPSTQDQSEALLDSLRDMLGQYDDSTGIVEDHAPRVQGEVAFYDESPLELFAGFAGEVLFETNLIFDENSDDIYYRLERIKDGVVLTRREASASSGVYHVYGRVLATAVGSEQEKAFIRSAMEEILETAAEPLQSALGTIRDSLLVPEGLLRDKLQGLLCGPPKA